jgi:hypothetical protein
MKVFTIIHTNQAPKIKRKGRSKERSFSFGNNTNTISIIQKRFTSFPKVVERTLNSIFIEACMRARKDEFKRENRVKSEIIVIPVRAREEL